MNWPHLGVDPIGAGMASHSNLASGLWLTTSGRHRMRRQFPSKPTTQARSRHAFILTELDWRKHSGGALQKTDAILEGYFFFFFLRQVLCFFGSWFYAFLFLWFSAFLLLCFSASLLTLLLCFSCFSASLLTLLLCFSCFSAFLLFAFPASLLFLLLFFSAFCFPSSLLFCFSVFPASLFMYFCAFLLLLFHFFFSSIMCFCCSTSCSFASLLPVFTVSLFFISFCFILFCLYPKWNPRETLGETQRNPKEILIRNPTWSPKWTLKKP